MILRLNWYEFLIWFYSWFTCWSFSGYASSIGILGGTTGEVVSPNISSRDLNS